MITIRNLAMTYRTAHGEHQAVRGVSLEVKQGEFYTLLGPSGCGKTTILRCVAGLEHPDAGEILIGGEVVFSAERGIWVPPHNRNIGMVFQSYAIWPHLSVFENVAFPLRIRRRPRAEVQSRVMRALDMVGLAALAARSAQLLSGGQQQRVAVARAIVHSPSVLLFDEPLSNLDAKLRDNTRAEIRRLQRELNVATVYVTHDQAEALSLSDRILVMREGIIRQEGSPQQIYAQPRDMFVADAAGAANFFDIEIRGVDGDELHGIAPDGSIIRARGTQAAIGPGRVMVRPDRLRITPDEAAVAADLNRLHGTVRQRLFLGGHFEYAVAVGATVLRVFSPVEIKEQSKVVVSFAPQDCILLGAEATQPQEEAKPWA
ncbi:MAG TPA: ABC transporter ATP-binding protein [Stellaceae bacterium]|nr:ABC transporter ATP-binding protein [Stellaceae bacterium]